MKRIIESRGGKRLRGLEEFEAPPFLGRMARVEERRRRMFRLLLALAFVAGGAIGWVFL